MNETQTASEGVPKRLSPRRMLAIIAGIIAVIVVVMLISAFSTAWERMLRLDCQSNLRQIGMRCREYAAGHDGHFPSTWTELNFVGDDANWAKLLRCPSTHHEVGSGTQVDLWTDYHLLPGRSTNDPSDRILALEPRGNHGSVGANVLFVDGATQWWPESRILGAGVGIATNPSTK
jgi:prepilin-type processing-associated H-X9-DG protein